MRSKTRSVIILLLLLTCHISIRAQAPIDPQLAEILQQRLDSCVNVFALPGASTCIRFAGNEHYWWGVSGIADIYSLEPMDTTFLFQLASMTKLFTSTMIFQMMEEGLLALEDPLEMYLPPINNVPGTIKISSLLRMRSGIADLLSNPNALNSWFDAPDTVWQPVDALEAFCGPPNFAENATFAYSNSNFLLLGAIIETISGQTFAAELRDRILIPLGLENTFFPPQEIMTGTIVPGWSSFMTANTFDTDVTPVLGNAFASMVHGAGGMIGTPWDVSLFTRALFNGDLISEASLEIMRTTSNVNFGDGANGYGHGVMRYNYGGRTYYGHGGDIFGFTQIAIHDPINDLSISVAINRNNAPRGSITPALLFDAMQIIAVAVEQALAETTLHVFPNPAQEQITVSAPQLQDGNYQVCILDPTGRRVKDLESIRSGTIWTLDIRDLSPGLYILKLENGSVEMGHRFIVE